MGVDFITCERCGHNFPDCGDFVRCNDECGIDWCSYECAEEDGYIQNYEEDENGWEIDMSTCKYCREEDFDDSELLVYALKLLDCSRDGLVAKYKKPLK